MLRSTHAPVRVLASRRDGRSRVRPGSYVQPARLRLGSTEPRRTAFGSRAQQMARQNSRRLLDFTPPKSSFPTPKKRTCMPCLIPTGVGFLYASLMSLIRECRTISWTKPAAGRSRPIRADSEDALGQLGQWRARTLIRLPGWTRCRGCPAWSSWSSRPRPAVRSVGWEEEGVDDGVVPADPARRVV